MRPARLALKRSILPTPASSPRPLLQRSALDREALPAVPPLVRAVLQAPARPLEAGTRALMEARFGYDFSRVQVHADATAAESARAVRARAYTLGSQVVFGAGQYAPDTAGGRRLIAHELAHVVQQGPVSAAGLPLAIGVRGHDRNERAAEAAAEGFASGADLRAGTGSAAAGLQRAEETPKDQTGNQTEDACAKQENDPESFSIQAAKHFLTEIDPTASQLAKTVECTVNPNNPEIIDCNVTFTGGQVIHVTWIKNLNNVETQRPTPDGRQWCVYHYVCDPSGEVRYEKKGCSSNVGPKPPSSAGPTLVGSASGAGGGGQG